MKLVVTLECRFVITPDGRVWTRVGFSRSFWERYLITFDGVKVAARTTPQAEVDGSYRQVNGPSVDVIPIADYVGPYQYLKVRHLVRANLRALLHEPDAFLCRVGSRLASDLIPALWRSGRPYGLEVVGDPYEVFRPGVIDHPLRALFRFSATRSLKQQCARAAAVSYVTEHTLQRRYPAADENIMYGISDVELPADYFIEKARVFQAACGTHSHRVLFVGSLAQMYKGPDVLIRAVHLLLKTGVGIHVTMIGDGRHRPELEHLASSLSLQSHVTFLGELPSGSAIRDQLDRASLFVLPSRTEGLPRAMVEAMARGLPCIGTTVGGIPELLDAEDLVVPDDAEALAQKIRRTLNDPQRLSRMSTRNLAKAQEFRPAILANRNREFYECLRDSTKTWLSRQAAGTSPIAFKMAARP